MNKKAEYGGWVIFLLVVIVLMVIGWAFTGNLIKPLDSDRDGLSDDEELRIGTDPQNPNTDGDRYLDGDDSDPLRVNSANIQIYLLDKDWSWGSAFTNAISIALNLGSLSSETVIADAEVKLLIKNEGDDYSEFVNYDILFEAANTPLSSVRDSIGRLNAREEKTKVYHEQILLKDAPNLLFNSIKEWTTSWDIRIDNLNYEKFS